MAVALPDTLVDHLINSLGSVGSVVTLLAIIVGPYIMQVINLVFRRIDKNKNKDSISKEI
jgi:hypothetical protein